MRRAKFALYFALGLFLVTLCTIVLLMVQVAPVRSNAPFMGIVIDPGSRAFTQTSIDSGSGTPIVYLPNRLFRCTEQNQQFRCQATLQNQPIQITFDHGKDYVYDLENCRATYAGQVTNCQPGWGGYMTNRGVLSYYSLNSNLGLTVPQLQAIQQQYWLTNLIGTSAEGLLWISTWAIALIGALLAIGLNWLEDNRFTRIFTSLSSGFVLSMLVRSWLGGLPYDLLAQYGIDEAAWNLGLPAIQLAVGVLASILTGLYVSRRTGLAVRGATSLMMGFAAASFAWFLVSTFSLMIPGGAGLRLFLSSIVGIGTVILLWRNARRSIRVFSSGMSALGAFTMLMLFLLYLSLNLGFAD